MGFIRGIGPLELIIVLVIVMMIFGVGKLPQVGQAMGKAMREFKKSQKEDVEDIISEETVPESATTEETEEKSQKSIT